MAQSGEPSVEDILASIKKVIAEDGARKPARNGGSASDPDSVLELTDFADPSALSEDGAEDPPILSNDSSQAMRESLQALATLSEPGTPPQIVRSGETSVEDLVREMLRPMMKDWLNANLPNLVEQMVAREIARITRKGQ